MSELAPKETCGRCAKSMEFQEYTRIGFAVYKCDPCKSRLSKHVSLALAREWLSEQE